MYALAALDLVRSLALYPVTPSLLTATASFGFSFGGTRLWCLLHWKNHTLLLLLLFLLLLFSEGRCLGRLPSHYFLALRHCKREGVSLLVVRACERPLHLQRESDDEMLPKWRTIWAQFTAQ